MSATSAGLTFAERLRAGAYLFRLSLWRQVWSRQTLVCLGLTLLLGTIVLAWSLQPNRTGKKFSEQVLLTTYIGFLLPIFAISYGASAIGGEREDRTLIYLLITPIPKPLAYLAKAAATLLFVWGWTLLSLTAFCGVARAPGWEVYRIYLPASLAGVSVYTTLFLLIGTAFRHGTIISLAYWFFLEVLFGAMPGIVKRITASFYIKCWIYDAGADLRLAPLGRVAREMFNAIDGDTAMAVMLAATAVCVAIGAWLFGEREFSELG